MKCGRGELLTFMATEVLSAVDVMSSVLWGNIVHSVGSRHTFRSNCL
jgi:hypothetical protein